MTLGELITETRKRWIRAFKLFKRLKRRQLQAAKENKVTPVITTTLCGNGTVDASCDIAVESFCNCTDNRSHGYEVGSCSTDSAYDTDGSSPLSTRKSKPGRHSIAYATVTYYNVKEREETSSINTVMTWIDYDGDGTELQNCVNEKIELMTSL